MKEETSLAKIEANQRNAQKSTGPRNSASTRYNAVKHGLLSKGIVEIDDPDVYRDLLARLTAELRPVGVIETFISEGIALDIVRILRVRRLEAEAITASLNPPITKTEGGIDLDIQDMIGTTVVLDPGLPASLPSEVVERLADGFARYETMTANRLLRAVKELRQMQRDRQAGQPPTTAPELAPPVVASLGNPASADTPAS
jgi:hypothetical protein